RGGVAAVRLRRGGGNGQREGSIGILRRRDRQAGQLAAGQGPAAVGVLGSGAESRPCRNAADGDLQRLRPVGVGQRRGDAEGDRRVLVPGRGLDREGRRRGQDVGKAAG